MLYRGWCQVYNAISILLLIEININNNINKNEKKSFSSVPYAASVSGISIVDCPFDFL